MPKAIKDGAYLAHHCPGCGHKHVIAIDEPFVNGARWSWNGSLDSPTTMPSVCIRWNEPRDLFDSEKIQKQIADRQAGIIDKIPQVAKVCHYFLRDGKIDFCGDCTHELAGQIVDMPDL